VTTDEPRYLYSECCLEDIEKRYFDDDYVTFCRVCLHPCDTIRLTEAEAEKMREERRAKK